MMSLFDDNQNEESNNQSLDSNSSLSNAAKKARNIHRHLSDKSKNPSADNQNEDSTKGDSPIESTNSSGSPSDSITNDSSDLSSHGASSKTVPPINATNGGIANGATGGITAGSGAVAGDTATGGAAAGGATASGTVAGGATASGTAAGGATASGAAAGGAAAGGAAAGGAAAAPVIVIALAIILVLFLISAFVIILTPENTSETTGKFIQSRNESTTGFTWPVSDFFRNLFGIAENVTPIEADESQYDKNNEFDVGMITNYNAINTALNADYEKFINITLRDYCTQHGYSYRKTKLGVEHNYPNGWRDIYANVNYGELISILALGYSSGAYGPDVARGDTDALSEFLMDEDNWYIFFNVNVPPESTDASQSLSIETQEPSTALLSYECAHSSAGLQLLSASPFLARRISSSSTTVISNIVDDSETESTESNQSSSERPFDVEEDGNPANITISPYCMKDLFSALNINKDAEYYDGVTYYEMLELMNSQNIAICSSASGGFRTIYYTLGLDKPSAPWEHNGSSSTVSDIFNNTGLLPVTGDNPSIVWQYLKTAGFTDEGAAGIMGNLMAEHGFNTSMEGEGGSVGIAQWAGGRKANLTAYAASMGLPVTDINVQASFMITELNSSRYDCIRNATDVITAADYTAYYYEACSRYSSYAAYLSGRYAGVISWSRYLYSELMNTYILDLEKRRYYSQYYYNMYSGTS